MNNRRNPTPAQIRRRSIIEATLAIVIMIGLGIGWWKVYVAPNDALLHATMDCVSERDSHVGDRATWDECYAENVAQAGGIIPRLYGPR